jgi:tRNA (uracil-5-)-methyltransferase
MGKRKRKNKQIFLDLAEKYRGSAEPACPYFGECGGCLFQDIAYEKQLALKKEYLNQLLQDVCSFERVEGSDPYGYRNRMDFVAAFGKRGLRRRGSFKEVIDLAECPLMQEKSQNVWRKLVPLLKDIEDYDYLKHEGYLRYVVLRQARYSGEVMCNFVISRDEHKLDTLINAVEPHVDSISLLLSDGLADLSFGPVLRDIKNGYITEKFADTAYHIYPNSFFQSNSRTAVEMYREIRKEATGRVLDLYSGVGSISLFVADKAESVIGIELVEEAVEAAEKNKALNGITNVTFVCQDARPFMRENRETFDTLIMDPPRMGIHPKMIKYIEELAPRKIIYMSCNPTTFKDNVQELTHYKIEKCAAYDMFPQTPHIEMLATLTRVK